MAGYGDDSGFADWLTANGYTLPESAPTPAVLRQRGSVYIDGTYGLRFPGAPADGLEQERAWPRTDAETIHGVAIPSGTVPSAIIEASYAAGYQEALAPGSLSVAVTASAAIKREKVGPLETEYFEGSGDAVKDATPLLSMVEGLLAPFLAPAGFPHPLVV